MLMSKARMLRSLARARFCWLICWIAVAAPAQALMAGKAPDSAQARVDANTASSPWASVGSVVVNGSPYSGVAITREHVLTASHVVGSATPDKVQFVLNNGPTPQTFSAAEISVFPSASFPYDDLAIIRLNVALPADLVIYPRIAGAPATGSVLTLVGYGASGNGDIGATVGGQKTVKRSGQNALDRIATSIDTSGRSSLFYLYDFDGPSGQGTFGGATLGNASETMVASGDSGSPAFLTGAGGIQLAGINTFVAAQSGGSLTYTFGNLGGGILLSDPRFATWINEKTQLSGGTDSDGEVPLPLWALLSLGIGFNAAFLRKPRKRQP